MSYCHPLLGDLWTDDKGMLSGAEDARAKLAFVLPSHCPNYTSDLSFLQVISCMFVHFGRSNLILHYVLRKKTSTSAALFLSSCQGCV